MVFAYMKVSLQKGVKEVFFFVVVVVVQSLCGFSLSVKCCIFVANSCIKINIRPVSLYHQKG